MKKDEDEIDSDYADMCRNEGDALTIEEIVKVVLVNKKRGTTVRVELHDAEDNKVELPEVLEQITDFMKDKLSEAENQFVDQIMPLMGQAAVSGLGRMMGVEATAMLLSTPLTRESICDMMCVAFLLLKFVQKEGLKIHTFEEEVSEEEIANIERRSKANSVMTMAAMTGMDPKQVVEEMLKRGDITEEDVSKLLGDDDDNDGKSN